MIIPTTKRFECNFSNHITWLPARWHSTLTGLHSVHSAFSTGVVWCHHTSTRFLTTVELHSFWFPFSMVSFQLCEAWSMHWSITHLEIECKIRLYRYSVISTLTYRYGYMFLNSFRSKTVLCKLRKMYLQTFYSIETLHALVCHRL